MQSSIKLLFRSDTLIYFFEDTDALSINLKRYLRCDYFLVWRFENWKFINPNKRNRTWVEFDVLNEFFPFFLLKCVRSIN